jgi:hypothetical protein
MGLPRNGKAFGGPIVAGVEGEKVGDAFRDGTGSPVVRWGSGIPLKPMLTEGVEAARGEDSPSKLKPRGSEPTVFGPLVLKLPGLKPELESRGAFKPVAMACGAFKPVDGEMTLDNPLDAGMGGFVCRPVLMAPGAPPGISKLPSVSFGKEVVSSGRVAAFVDGSEMLGIS